MTPRFLGAYHNLGHALLDLGRIAEAIDIYRIALRTDPDHPVVLADLGVALALQNNHDEATACYLRVLEINPEDAETHYNLGNTLRATGKPEKAIESYRVAIRLRPADADAHVNLGLVYLSLGNFHDGWKEYDWQWRREGAPVRPFPPTPGTVPISVAKMSFSMLNRVWATSCSSCASYRGFDEKERDVLSTVPARKLPRSLRVHPLLTKYSPLRHARQKGRWCFPWATCRGCWGWSAPTRPHRR